MNEQIFSGWGLKVEAQVWVNKVTQIIPFKSGGGATVLSNITTKLRDGSNVNMPVKLTIFNSDMVAWLVNEVEGGNNRFNVRGQLALETYQDGQYTKAGLYADVARDENKKPMKHSRTEEPYGMATPNILVDEFTVTINKNTAGFLVQAEYEEDGYDYEEPQDEVEESFDEDFDDEFDGL